MTIKVKSTLSARSLKEEEGKMADKRKGGPLQQASAIVKRARVDDANEDDDGSGNALMKRGTALTADGNLIRTVPRTSELQAPIMQLNGHSVSID